MESPCCRFPPPDHESAQLNATILHIHEEGRQRHRSHHRDLEHHIRRLHALREELTAAGTAATNAQGTLDETRRAPSALSTTKIQAELCIDTDQRVAAAFTSDMAAALLKLANKYAVAPTNSVAAILSATPPFRLGFPSHSTHRPGLTPLCTLPSLPRQVLPPTQQKLRVGFSGFL